MKGQSVLQSGSEDLFKEGRIDQLDIDIGREVGEGLLGIYLAKAFRLGHMRVEIGKRCEPSPKALFLDVEGAPPEDSVVESIERSIAEDFKAGAFNPDRVKIDGSGAFFPYSEAVENSITRAMAALSSAEPDVLLEKGFWERAERDIGEAKLHEEQTRAIRTLLSTTCGFLTGGPGTGKTFTAGMWLKILTQSSTPLHIALCAPTGRASQTLAASIQKSVGEKASFDVQTIHKLLLSPFSFFPYNVLVVDECSMIDSALFAKLLGKVRPGTRVLFLGDPDQLPPIDPGHPFRSLLNQMPDGAKKTSLSQSHRTESKEILELARAFLQGKPFQKVEATGAVKRIDISGVGGRKRLEMLIEEHIIAQWERISSPEEACAALRQSIILTPTRVGSLGTERINEFVRSRRKKDALIPVAFFKNDHELGVMNGDLGVLEHGWPLDYVYTLDQKLPAAVCPRFEEAYAMSVHKSQGSEFHRVILILPPGVDCSPHLLYTAATRARSELIVVG